MTLNHKFPPKTCILLGVFLTPPSHYLLFKYTGAELIHTRYFFWGGGVQAHLICIYVYAHIMYNSCIKFTMDAEMSYIRYKDVCLLMNRWYMKEVAYLMTAHNPSTISIFSCLNYKCHKITRLWQQLSSCSLHVIKLILLDSDQKVKNIFI